MSEVLGLGERRPASETRQLLLDAARRRFAARPYADVTLRDIAADAAVSPALVVKYFGTKEQLFDEAADFGQQLRELLAVPDDRLAVHLVTHLLDVHEVSGSNPLMFVLFMSRRPDAPQATLAVLQAHLLDALEQRLAGSDAGLRAELICAQLIGLSAMRRALRSPALTHTSTAEIVARMAPALQLLIDG